MRAARFGWLVVWWVSGVGSAVAGTSNSLLDVSPDGRRLIVANPDSGSVSVVETTGEAWGGAVRLVREIKVGTGPESAAIVGPGPLAVVAVFGDDAVVVVEMDAGQVVQRVVTADEPYGVALSPDGRLAYVTHDTPGQVSVIDIARGKVVREFPVGARPRGIAIDAAGRRLVVAHYDSSTLSVWDAKSGAAVSRHEGGPYDNLARQTVLMPSGETALVPFIRSVVTVPIFEGAILPFLGIVDLRPGPARGSGERAGKDRFNVALDFYDRAVNNPWEVAISPDGKRAYTVNAGTDDVVAWELVGGRHRARSAGRAAVGNNPRAVRTSPDGRIVYVYNALSFDLSVLSAEPLRPIERVRVTDNPLAAGVLRGKILFNTALPPMAAARWVSCASCHFDGQADGRTWQFEAGPRNTVALFGVKHTAPIHWSADRDEVQDFEHTIRSRLMRGRGLIGDRAPNPELGSANAGLSADLDALAAYVNSLEHPRSRFAAGPGRLTAAAERGRALFFDKRVGCAECHPPPHYTDSTTAVKPFVVHDVGTGEERGEKMGPRFDTPTLLGIYRTAPYLHDGKAATLRDVLTTFNKGDRHGKTRDLTAGELDDLVEFLKSLPY